MSHAHAPAHPLIKIDVDLETGTAVMIGPTGVRIPLDDEAAVRAALDAAADDAPPGLPMPPELAQAMLAEQMHHCPDCAANPEVLAAGYLDASGRMIDTTNQMRAARGQPPLRRDADANPDWWRGKRTERPRRQRRGRR